jgi:hypothetical protein
VSKKFFLILFICLFPLQIFAVQKGSESILSIEPYFVFPSADSDNAMLAFGWFKSGFGLQDATTTCTFGSAFPVSGNVNLHGGQLFLDTDLSLNNPSELVTPGFIRGNDHILDLCESITGLPSSSDTILDNTKLFINSDINLSGTLRIRGDCVINGRGHCLVLDGDGCILIDNNASLRLKNIEVDGISGYNIRCLNDSGSLIMDEVRWVQDDDYTFSQGSIRIHNEVDVTGRYRFTYSSGLTSTVASDSTWFFSDLAQVSFGRKNGIFDREPLFCEDASSVLRLEHCTLIITASGMQFTRGTFLCDREVILDIESTSTSNGFILGNGIAEDDATFKLFPSAVLKLNEGHFIYDVVAAENFLTDDVEVKFIRSGNSVFYSKQDVHCDNVSVYSNLTSSIVFIPGKQLYYDNCFFSYPFADFRVTGLRYSPDATLLYGGCEFYLVKGNYPAATLVQGPYNFFLGSGDISGPTILLDSTSHLSVGLDGSFFSDITLGGGSVALEKNIVFGQHTGFVGAGSVIMGTYDCTLGSKDLNWTSSISWNAQGSSINLNADIALSSEWVFSGNCIIDGGGKRFALLPTGKIKIGSGSSLRFRNIFITGIDGNNIECIDDSASLILDGVRWDQDDSFSFSHGSLNFINRNDFTGTGTFYYESTLTSSIGMSSIWGIHDDMGVVLGRNNGREPLFFEDTTSVLEVDSGTFSVTSSGMKILRGMVKVNKKLTFDINSTHSHYGLSLGNGISSEDCSVKLDPGASLYLPKGHFIYACTTETGIQSITRLTRVTIDPALHIVIDKNASFKNLTVEFSGPWDLVVGAGAVLSYKDCAFSAAGIEFLITGKRYNFFTTLLDGNGKITAQTGALPLSTLIAGSGNIISGPGSIAAPIVCSNQSASFSWDVVGAMSSYISLNKSSVTLTKPLQFSDNQFFNGQGKVNLSNLSVSVGGLSLYSTSTLDWDSNKASIVLRSNLQLTSKWTFSGDCTINGDGNSLIFGPTGQIAIGRGSRVRFKNVVIDGLLDGSLYCIDNAGKLIFDNVTWSQDSNFTFSLGSFDVINQMDMNGRDYQFLYQSDAESRVKSRASLYLRDDFTFSYEPASESRTLLSLADDTTRLIMKNASIASTSTGLQLTKGYLEVRGVCNFISGAGYPAEGIIIGDGLDETNDLRIEIFPESRIELNSGYLVYKNLA